MLSKDQCMRSGQSVASAIEFMEDVCERNFPTILTGKKPHPTTRVGDNAYFFHNENHLNLAGFRYFGESHLYYKATEPALYHKLIFDSTCTSKCIALYFLCIFMPPDRMIGGILFLSCLSVCLFVCLSVCCQL